MNIRPSCRFLRPWNLNPRSGSALLITLGCVALLTLLITAFLVAARTEYSSSTFYARGVNTKILSDTAVNLVIAQINQATRSKDALTGSPVAWASQPGMIRTFDTSGTAVSDYKLYSWDNMATAAGGFNQAQETAPTGWDTMTGVWTDLNEPIQTSSDGPIYPILQGTNPVTGLSLQAGLTDIYGNAVPGKSYHMASDSGSAGSLADVEGFYVNAAPTQSNPAPVNPDVPMPVKWIYILQDGTTVVAQPGGTATAASVPGATSSNKIVGRIAFWTDDETSKVNINTASEGNFWDVPLADGREERTLAINIPVQGEYQRIPGHPATVSLSSVFGAQNEFFPGTWSPPDQVGFSLPGDSAVLTNLYGLTPRMQWGGTQFGTAPYSLTAETSGSPAYYPYSTISYTLQAPPAALVTKANRLYSTIDELLFNDTSANPTRTPNSLITPATLDRVKFFITANSTAPEVTLFNTPRISMWPITWPNNDLLTGPVNGSGSPVINVKGNPLANNTYYTNTAPPMLMPEEKLLAFCGTVGGVPYYFQRKNAYDPTWDYTYIPRNQNLIGYLNTMTAQSVPGFGGNFASASKYGADQPQIITEMFDYIRSGPNLNNSVAGTSGSNGQLQINYNYTPIASRDFNVSLNTPTNGNASTNGGNSTFGGGSVVPIHLPNGTMGAGRYATVTEAALVFYAADRTDPQPGLPKSADQSGPTGKWEFIGPNSHTDPSITDSLAGSQTTSLGMYLLLNIYNPMTGYLSNTPYFVAQITGSPFNIAGQTVTFPQTSANRGETLINMAAAQAIGGYGSSLDAMMGCTWTLAGYYQQQHYGKGLTKGPYPVASGPNSTYPFFITPVSVSPTANTFAFSAPSDTVLTIYPVDPSVLNTHYSPRTADGTVDSPVQTIHLDFSQLNGTYPMPVAPEYNQSAVNSDNTQPVPTSANVPKGTTLPPTTIPPREIYQPPCTYYFSRTNTAGNASPAAIDSSTGQAPASPWGGTVNGSLVAWDMRNLLARFWMTQYNGSNPNYFNSSYTSLPTLNVPLIAESYNSSGDCADTVISLRLDPTKLGGDARLLAMTSNVPSTWFVPHYALSSVQNQPFPVKGAHSLGLGQNEWGIGYITNESIFGFPYGYGNFSESTQSMGNPTAWIGQNTSALKTSAITGDFCNGIGGWTDGAIIPKPDDTTFSLGLDPVAGGGLATPYYNGGIQSSEPYFSPARQISGPVMLGSLPTGVQAHTPWQTLAFNPNPIIGPGHKGLTSPADYLLLDLFWMPVVEPYAISEPLSTAGKINMNYQIEPFTYINRKTALYAAMKSDKVFAIPTAASNVYKNPDKNCGVEVGVQSSNINNTWGFHFPVDVYHTLQQFDTVFNTGPGGNVFVSAAQICSIFLDPRNNPLYTSPVSLPDPDPPGSTANIAAWWSAASASTALTGANGRQQPYAHLYSLLTTKSNTFQVHMRVQVLSKNSRTSPSVFDESAGDSVVGEYRGSAIIERYVDANDSTLPDFATTFSTAGSNTLDSYYRFRIVSAKAFTPK